MVLPFKASGIGIFTVLRPVLLPKLIPVLVVFIVLVNLPFSVVDQMAGAATRAPERSPHGLHKI
jgi:hypothetical protein